MRDATFTDLQPPRGAERRRPARTAGALATAALAAAVACGSPPLSTADAARAAVIFDTCGGWTVADRSAQGVMVASAGRLDPLTERMIHCAARAASCDAFHDCVSGGRRMAGAPPGGRCEGDLLVASVFGTPAAIDCRVWTGGGTCEMAPTGARCVPRGGCADATSVRCDGRVAVNCTAGDFAAIDCGLLDERAACAVQNSQAVCVVSDRPPCEPGASARCDGDVVVRCERGGARSGPILSVVAATDRWREERVDCGAVGLGCARGVGCVPRTNACEPGRMEVACDGDAVAVCVAGRVERVPCASVGRARCQYNRCVP